MLSRDEYRAYLSEEVGMVHSRDRAQQPQGSSSKMTDTHTERERKRERETRGQEGLRESPRDRNRRLQLW